jgi:UDP-N-acetylmuramoyl-tripeptide--D-alanyl-D-alanine ligase
MRAYLSQIAAVIPGARLVNAPAEDTAFDGVSTDSRNVAAGALFVALRGEHFDAHDFLPQVAEKGAAAVVAEALPEGWALPAVVVPDTLAALGLIANFWRRQFAIPVIGVTGSNGKTTVKEMIASILAAAFGEDARLATRGNLNNEIGVPLTLMRLGQEHRAAVIEMGMNHPGEIGRLSAIAQPTLAMVNNAQREHQEFMHTVEAVALENGAVLAGLAQDGVAVFPHGDEFTELWRGLAGTRRTITFGLSKDADVSCTFRPDEFGNNVFITIDEKASGVATSGAAASAASTPLQFFVALQAAGEHNVRNALAAAASAYGAGIAPEDIKRGLEAFAPVSGRLQRKKALNGATVIDDSYNANPDSVRAAIDVLALAEAPRILVLGDMGEVGDSGPEFHEEVGAYAVAKGIEHVLVTGELARHARKADSRVEHFDDFTALLAALDARLAQLTTLDAEPFPTVLIKGSRFMKMERAVQHLTGSQGTSKSKDTH